MTEKIKTKTRTKSTTSKPRKATASIQSQVIQDRQVIRLLTICFTLLSVAFTAMAFWKYPLN